MRDSIYTIPISEVFEPKCGCPLCTMRNTLDNRCIDYILGAAMMEPDVRLETNKYGFCERHFEIMLAKNNKLSLALMIKTHLDELKKQKPSLKPQKHVEPTCFVCKEIDGAMRKIVANTVTLYTADNDFRKLFCEQPFFCFPHYKLLCEIATTTLHKKVVGDFIDTVTEITMRKMQEVTANVHDFTLMFDYRNADKPKTAEVTSAVENAVKFLVGRI